MYGAIIGDIVGSRFEFMKERHKSTEFELFTDKCHFTDDTVLTVATMDAILEWEKSPTKNIYGDMYKIAGGKYIAYTLAYPRSGFGGRYLEWAIKRGQANNDSYGNGCVMRISPMAYVGKLDKCLDLSYLATVTSHDSQYSRVSVLALIKAIYLLKSGFSKSVVEKYIHNHYFSMNINLDEIRPTYQFDCTCQNSVPQAFKCFFDSTDFESAIRLAVSLGGDTDTQAAIAGSLAEAYYGVPQDLINKARTYLTPQFLEIIDEFDKQYGGIK